MLLTDVFIIDNLKVLEESKGEPFKSSEKALILTENVDKKEANKSEGSFYNDLLTPEVMKFMPSNPDS